MVLADNIGPLVNYSFKRIDLFPSTVHWWIVVIGFAFQIYFDFSGYSLIARGLAKLMGYHFKMNFNHPYLANSLKDFWKRWHISLSTWFRDYVYLPLGGNKKGKFNSILFMTITMLLSGLWHGAAYTFIIWGGIHALGLAMERTLLNKIKIKPIRYFITMLFVLIGWVFFRATNFNQAIEIIEKLFIYTPDNAVFKPYTASYIFIGLAILFEIFYFFESHIVSIKKITQSSVFDVFQMGLMLFGILFFRGKQLDFIYFQF